MESLPRGVWKGPSGNYYLEEVIEHEHGSQIGEELAAIALERNIIQGEPIGRKGKI